MTRYESNVPSYGAYVAWGLAGNAAPATRPERKQCPECLLYGGQWIDGKHTCTVYDGPPCKTCGQPTLAYTVGAPGYGAGRCCKDGHDEKLTPHGILTTADVR